MNNFYNTTNLEGSDLEKAESKSLSQQELILSFFKNHPVKEYTPFEVQSLVGLKSPITSIRRAMTNLTKDGKLEKTGRKKAGAYGMLNYTWKFKQPGTGQIKMF